MIRRHHLVALSVPGSFLVAALVGCSTRVVAPAPAEEPPAASSAAGAVSRLAWGFSHKDLDVVRGLLADDFLFITAATDSAGNPTSVPNDRTWFLAALAALMDSSSTVSFVLDGNLVAFPDSRPGRNPTWHRQVRTPVHVVIRGSGSIGDFDVTGNALFFAIRGDSAAIPQELRARGAMPDSTRWWLDRYEDETLAGAGMRDAAQGFVLTLGMLLRYFCTLVAR